MISTRSRRLRRAASAGFVGLFALGPAAAAFAAEECGPAGADGKVVCDQAGSPYGEVDYNGAQGIDLTVSDGVIVNGSVNVLGDGAIKVTAVAGSQINGQTAPALDLGSTSGSVEVDVHAVTGGLHGVAAVAGGDVSVSADEVVATIAIQADSVGGDVTVDAREIHAVGEGGAGIVASTETGAVDIQVEQVFAEDAFYSQGVAAFSDSGDIAIDAGSIKVDGHRSEGVRIETYSGDVSVKVDSIDMDGGEIVGISVINDTGHTAIDAGSVSLKGDVARGVFAASFADIDLRADSISTHGFIADAVQLISTEGDIKAAVGEIVTRGDWSVGISAETGGAVAFELGSVKTYGEYSDGIGAFTGAGDIAIAADRVETFGRGSNGITAGSGDGDQMIEVGVVIAHGGAGEGGVAIGAGSFRGDIDIQVGEAAVSKRDAAIVAQSVRGAVRVAVAEDAVVRGRLGGIFADAGRGAKLDIAGVVTAAEGPALDLRGGRAEVRIASSGAVAGNVLLTGGNDLLVNQGRLILTGESDFGEGEDRLVNSGVIRLGATDGPAALAINKLERLQNSGLISLADGRTGDRLALAGELSGAGGGAIALDVSLDSGVADTVRVGSLAGVTELRLEYAEAVGGLGLGGVVLARAEGELSGGELVLAEESRNLGFVEFELDFNAANGSWRLNGGMNDRGYRAVLAGAGARDLWREGVRAWSGQLAATRTGGGEGLSFWTQGLIGANERDGAAATSLGSRRLEWRTDHHGVQFGAEQAANGWRFGLVGGYGGSESNFGGGEASRFESVNAAAYLGYAGGGWFANAMLRADWLDVETDWASVGLSGEDDGGMIGAVLEVGHRSDFGSLWIEPFAAIQWSDLDLPDLASTFGSVAYSGGTKLAAEFGARVEAADGWAGLPFRPSLMAALAVEGGGGNEAELRVGDDRVLIEENGARSYGRAGLGLAKDFGRIRLFASGEGRFGEVQGYNATVGVKLGF